VDEVRAIHDRLCADFATTQDPIEPPGVRSLALLESAVGRQHSGFDSLLKYHDPILNAASLLYGICNDHPFHNGNKRTALVAALAHLDRNHLVLRTTRQRDVGRLMIAVADHALLQQPIRIGRNTEITSRRGSPDEEVAAIASWLRPRVCPTTRGEQQITYRELRQILANFDFSIGAPRNHKVAVIRTDRRLLFGPRQTTVMSLDWPGDGKTVVVSTIKHIRSTLQLREEDGVTRDIFYDQGVRIDRFINDYRLVLRRLASR
jgi:death-on-curing protein